MLFDFAAKITQLFVTNPPSAGGSVYGTGTAFALTAAGTAGQVLPSNGASAPTWSGISGGTF